MNPATIPAESATAAVMVMALTAYALLGGADFGAGVWDLLARGPRAEAQRNLIAHAIGPVWEANHVWLIIVVVLLFTGFPAAFAAIVTALHVPLSLMLIGIVLRGSAFTFRSYDNTELGRRRWNRAFAMPSVVTPVLLGMILGAVAAGNLPARPTTVGDLFGPWLRPFPIAVGFFTLGLFAYLAAVYLILETDEPALRDDFRRRALIAAVAVGALAYAVYLLARDAAPLVFQGLNSASWGFQIRVATGAFAILALTGLWFRLDRLARGAAMAQVALILWGCALAQSPYLVPPTLSIRNAAAPAVVHRLLLGALAIGSMILLPSLYYMFRVFKGHTLMRNSEFGLRNAEKTG
ncbi:MAG TPA: cytochrome d ubiquinol oxidase subunit II [Isosphaeraceae bacterium]|jgi:cytochrome d ubiquinol oxidase subunit II|nr:cytochrome d ubiquinol oxidase subunit II [Isosphaeraceae bacterium]